MRADDEIPVPLKPEPGDRTRAIDLRQVMGEHFVHRAASLNNAIRGQSLGEQIIASNRGVGEVYVSDVIDDAPVDLLRYALIEAAVARLHVEYRNLAALGWNNRQAAIGIAEHEQSIKPILGQHAIHLDEDLADCFGGTAAGCLEKEIGRAQIEIAEENVIELRVVILASMDDAMITKSVELRNDAGESNDFRTRSDNRHNL